MTEIVKRIHPGVILKHSIEAVGMSAKEFSYRTGISEKTISNLINLKGSITFDIAEKLSSFFGNDVRLWTNLQTQYSQNVIETTLLEQVPKGGQRSS